MKTTSSSQNPVLGWFWDYKYISLDYKHTITESLTRNKPCKYMLYKYIHMIFYYYFNINRKRELPNMRENAHSFQQSTFQCRGVIEPTTLWIQKTTSTGHFF